MQLEEAREANSADVAAFMDAYDPVRMPANQRAKSEEEAHSLGLRLHAPQDIVADAEAQVAAERRAAVQAMREARGDFEEEAQGGNDASAPEDVSDIIEEQERKRRRKLEAAKGR